jgi:DNA-binding MarR family transcriptional regulator
MSGHSNERINEKDLIHSPMFALLLAADLLARRLIEMFGPDCDVTMPEWRCLVVLHAKGALWNSEVTDLTGLGAMTVNRALDRLTRAGRLEQARDPDDGRRQINQVTSAGHALYRSTVKLARDRQEAMARGLTAEETKRFGDMLQRVVKQLRASE